MNNSTRLPACLPACLGICSAFLAAFSAGVDSPPPPSPTAKPPVIVPLTRAAIETNTHPRFTLLAEVQSEGMMRFTVVFPRRQNDHLADASMRVIQDGREAVTLAIPIVVDNHSDDRAVFSASTETARLCVLVLETGPRLPRPDEPAVTLIYRVDLSTFVPPPRPESGDESSPGQPASEP